jgi:hypothetical protein
MTSRGARHVPGDMFFERELGLGDWAGQTCRAFCSRSNALNF